MSALRPGTTPVTVLDATRVVVAAAASGGWGRVVLARLVTGETRSTGGVDDLSPWLEEPGGPGGLGQPEDAAGRGPA